MNVAVYMKSVPRVCGDDPVVVDSITTGSMCSPRVRG